MNCERSRIRDLTKMAMIELAGETTAIDFDRVRRIIVHLSEFKTTARIVKRLNADVARRERYAEAIRIVQTGKCPICGADVIEQYDHYGIYCGRMCDASFKAKYRQDAYAADGDCEPLEPEDF